MAWETKELIKSIVIILVLSGAFIFFISKAGGKGGVQNCFDGKVMENDGRYLTIEVDPEYNDLVERLGGYVEIDIEEVFAESDFSRLKRGEDVRVVYNEFDLLKEGFDHVYAIYLQSEIHAQN